MFGKPIKKKKQDSQEVVGNAVMELRKSMELTQKELANRVGKPQSTIARIETGNMAPSFSLISDIAMALNKKLNISFEDMDDKESMWTYPLVIFGYESKEVWEGRLQVYKWARNLVEKFNTFLEMNNLQVTFLDFTMSYAKFSFRYNIDFEQEGIPKDELEMLEKFQQWEKMLEVLMDLEEVEIHSEQNYLFISVKPEKLLPINIRELFEAGLSDSGNHPLQAVLGEGEDGEAVTLDLSQHSMMLILGATGSGKNIALNSLITSIMAHNHPDQVNFAFIDPHQVEFHDFRSSPFCFEGKVLTKAQESVLFLEWLYQEKLRRLEVLSKYGLGISEFNDRVEKNEITDEKIKPLILIIDEYPALLRMTKDKAQELITDIGKADAKEAGIHLILVTQNLRGLGTSDMQELTTARWVFRTSDLVDSEIALGRQGAEKLRGHGDSYLYQEGDDKLTRLQAPFIDYKYRETINEYLERELGKPINRNLLEDAK
jgi:DNA segregation ATPase FtsK/SpoIIIE and related proteins